MLGLSIDRVVRLLYHGLSHLMKKNLCLYRKRGVGLLPTFRKLAAE